MRFEYQWSYSDEEQRNDAVIDDVLLVSRDYELYLMGLELDYSFDDFESCLSLTIQSQVHLWQYFI